MTAMRSTIGKAVVAVALAAFAARADEYAFKREVACDAAPEWTTGAYRPFVMPGGPVESDGIVELRQGHTLTLYVPKALRARARTDEGAAARLRLFDRFLATPFVPVGSVRVGYAGGKRGAALLKRLGVAFSEVRPQNVRNVATRQVLVMGPDVAESFRTPRELEGLRHHLSALEAVVVMPGADLTLLPFPVRVETAKPAARVVVPDMPLFLGIRQELAAVNARAKDLPVLAGGPAWTVATTPAVCSLTMKGTLPIVVLTVGPGDVPGAERELTRLWCMLLANLNVETRAGNDIIGAR